MFLINFCGGGGNNYRPLGSIIKDYVIIISNFASLCLGNSVRAEVFGGFGGGKKLNSSC